jgi:hypothetical protein
MDAEKKNAPDRDAAMISAAAALASRHARRCHECSHPIIDEEGNPGLFGEACPTGVRLLARYCEVTGDPIPAWVKKLFR